MATTTGLRQGLQAIQETLDKVIRYVSAAVTRIFGLNDDNYPATGVQPFEGEPAEDERY